MKLPYAAALSALLRSRSPMCFDARARGLRPRPGAALLLPLLVAGVLTLVGVGPVQALDSIDLSAPFEEGAEAASGTECPRLIEIKYPFLRCTNGQIGQAAADESWDDQRSIPLLSRWSEGDAAWGPTLNLASPTDSTFY